jgi:hypothetical protein
MGFTFVNRRACGNSESVQCHSVVWVLHTSQENPMRTLFRSLLLSTVVLASGCIVVPVEGHGYYHHCYHCR